MVASRATPAFSSFSQTFTGAKEIVAFAPARVWEKDGKAGVALEATMLVLQEGEIRTKMQDCFSLDTL